MWAAVAANNLAYLYTLRSEKLDTALQLAQTAKQKLPDDPAIIDTLGWVYYKKNLPDLAIPILRQSVEREPSNYLYHYHLGLAVSRTGDKPQARASLERALQLKSTGDEADDARRILATVKG